MKLFFLSVSLLLFSFAQAQNGDSLPDKTSFQIAAPWDADYDVRSDIAMVYGYDSTFAERVKGYREHGYHVQFMTGIAWGNYQDYFSGQWDGKNHLDEGQMDKNGDSIGHGRNVPYTVPTNSYIAYFKTLIKKVIDAGITTIYLEEPEFWARGGYSEAFKREWKDYYNSPWMPQHESPEATYLSSKLKYHLYFKALKEVFAYAKQYGNSRGRTVRCFVPTHSLLNYSSWQIVSPEASLAALDGMDGYIAQVWTGTSREPVYFNGVKKERVFENAFLEYGCMLSMTEPTHRTMYFLTDPIEDRPRTWDDYKRNYEATFTAEILYPTVSHYEVMPWPNRIYKGKFKLENKDEKQSISPDYATQMQVMVNALNKLPASTNTISGSAGIGVLAGNSMMFQRYPTFASYEDPQLSNFYGMILPFIKRGVPAEIVHMENLHFPKTLKNTKVLVMSYTNMKPQSEEVNKQLAAWVKNGGTLMYVSRDNDPFQTVKEWWNSNGNHFKTPSEHLFQLMNIKPAATGETGFDCGKGKVYVIREDPKELVMTADADTSFFNLASVLYQQATGSVLSLKNNFYLARGAYDIASVMEESITNASLFINGPVIDLFDPSLPILSKKEIKPGEQSFLFAIDRVQDKQKPQVLCASSRETDEKRGEHSYSFTAKSPENTNNVMRILLPAKPASVVVKNASGIVINEASYNWDEATHTLLLKSQNESAGISVSIQW